MLLKYLDDYVYYVIGTIQKHYTTGNMTLTITNAIISAYCLCHHCCPQSSHGLCANGKSPIEGRTIAASRVYPLGSTVTIGQHAYKVEDRLAKRFDQRFDVYFKSHKKALEFGKQTIKTITINIP